MARPHLLYTFLEIYYPFLVDQKRYFWRGPGETAERGTGASASGQPGPHASLSPAGALEAGSRSGAGQMPDSEDESQGIAVKGLLCPLRHPGSDLGCLRMICRTPKCTAAALAHARQTERDRERVTEFLPPYFLH